MLQAVNPENNELEKLSKENQMTELFVHDYCSCWLYLNLIGKKVTLALKNNDKHIF